MIVEFGKLKAAVAKVKATVAKAGSVEAFTRICIRNGKLSSFDGMSGTITSCPLDGFEFCIPSKKLIALVDVLGKKSGTIEHSDGWLSVQCGDYSTRIPTFDVIEFPDLMPQGATKVFCTATNLVAVLKACAVTMEADESKKQLNGVALRGGYAYSTDGKRLTRAILDSPVSDGSFMSIASPAVNQLVRLGQPKYLFWSGPNICALYPKISTLLLARCMVSEFPFDIVDTALAARSDAWSYPVPPTLLDVVERVRALVDDEESQLLLRADGTTLTVETKATQTGGAKETLPFNIRTDFDIKIKAESLRSTLRSLKPTHIDLTDIAEGQQRMLLFRGDGFEHALALMS